MQLILNLKTSRKFTLLAALAAVAILLPCWLYVRAALTEHAFVAKELRGLPVVRALYDLIRVTQEHRGLSSVVLAGGAAAVAPREAKVAEVERAMQKLNAQLDEAGAAPVRKALTPLEGQWKTLVADVAAKRATGPQSFARHSALVDLEMQALTETLDYFNLALDPEAGTYYSITGTMMHGVQLMEHLGRMRALGAGALTRKSAWVDEAEAVHAELVLVQDNYARSQRDLEKSAEADASLVPYQAARKKLDDDLKAVLVLAREQVVRGGFAFAAPRTSMP